MLLRWNMVRMATGAYYFFFSLFFFHLTCCTQLLYNDLSFLGFLVSRFIIIDDMVREPGEGLCVLHTLVGGKLEIVEHSSLSWCCASSQTKPSSKLIR